MQQTGHNIDTDFGTGLLRNINRKSYQNTWSPSDRNTIVNGVSRDRRTSLADLEKICAHLSVSPNRCDRLRSSTWNASAVNTSFVSQSSTTSKMLPLHEEQLSSKNLKNRRASTFSAHGSKGNHLEKISEINQTASTCSLFETLPTNASSDDNTSTKSSITITTTTSNPKRPIRKFIVTPVQEKTQI